MTLKYLILYFPATVLTLLVVSIFIASAFPLSWMGQIYNYQPRDAAEIALAMMTMICYLLVYYVLSRFGVNTLWLRGTIALVGAGIIAVVVAMSMIGAAISGGSKNKSILINFAWWLTTPLRNEHYLGNLESTNVKHRKLAAAELYYVIEPRDTKQEKIRLFLAFAKAFNNEQDAEVRRALLLLLKKSHLKDATLQREILYGLTAKDAEIRKAAAGLLGHAQEPQAEIITTLLAVVKNDPDQSVRHQVMMAVSQLAPHNKELEKLLLAAMEQGDPVPATILFDINQKDSRVTKRFAHFISSTNPAVRAAWIDAIQEDRSSLDDFFRPGGIRPGLIKVLGHAFDLQRALLDALKDRDAHVRVSAISALARVYPHDAEVAQTFAEMLKDNEPRVRLAAVERIREYIFDLMKGDSDPPKSKQARVVDIRIQRALAARLLDTDTEIRIAAALCLGIAAPTEPAIQLAMIATLNNEAEETGYYCRNLIDGIIEGSKSSSYTRNAAVLGAAKKLLQHPDEFVRLGGLMIAQWNRPTDSAGQLALIREMIGAKDMDLGANLLIENAAEILTRIHPLSNEAVSELTRIATDQDGDLSNYEVKTAAAKLLQQRK